MDKISIRYVNKHAMNIVQKSEKIIDQLFKIINFDLIVFIINSTLIFRGRSMRISAKKKKKKR